MASVREQAIRWWCAEVAGEMWVAVSSVAQDAVNWKQINADSPNGRQTPEGVLLPATRRCNWPGADTQQVSTGSV